MYHCPVSESSHLPCLLSVFCCSVIVFSAYSAALEAPMSCSAALDCFAKECLEQVL